VANDAQIEHWNRDEANHWVEHQDRYDAMLAPFGSRLLAAAAITASDRLVDVGCGCGATTLAAAQLAAAGTATGVDVSAPMLDVARRRAIETAQANVAFVEGDAQTVALAGEYDVIISRFGMMFFDDPLAAFTNLANTPAPGGRLTFVCWQELTRNEFVLVPGMAVAQHVALPDLGPPGAPGMFSLSDPQRTRLLLTKAGFVDVMIEPIEERILLGGGGTLDDTVTFLRHGGMARAVLTDVDAATETRVLASVTEALSPFLTEDGVRIGAAAWLVTAQRP
jgi:SAM-dependent methyltransferase